MASDELKERAGNDSRADKSHPEGYKSHPEQVHNEWTSTTCIRLGTIRHNNDHNQGNEAEQKRQRENPTEESWSRDDWA
jgi:hypothetical protein